MPETVGALPPVGNAVVAGATIPGGFFGGAGGGCVGVPADTANAETESVAIRVWAVWVMQVNSNEHFILVSLCLIPTSSEAMQR